jgi:TRAP transporter TAXI family solute receptor
MNSRTIPQALSFVLVLAAAAVGAWSGAFAADILIGAGSKAGVHNEVGRAICRQVQKAGEGLTCEAFAIEGRDAAEPIAVLSGVRTGTIEMGLVSSDWQYHAVQGSGPVAFMDVKFDNLRSIFSLHSEPFTLVARRDSGIDALDDLAGKRVNIGRPGSNPRAVMEMVMAAKGWTRDSFQLTDELSDSEQSLALCHNRVQAMVLTAAHPNAALAKTIKLCDAKLVEVTGPEVDKLVQDNGYLAATEVPAGAYDGMDKSVATFGVTVTLVSSTDIDEELIYSVTRSLFDNLDDFKRLHPAFGNLTPERMITDGLSAPAHPGAIRYYLERGMM